MAREGSLADAAGDGDQLSQLKTLALLLASDIDAAESREVPGLARQYRETLRDIRELEGGEDDGDEVNEVVLRLRSGKP
ncbi:hypothetical protein [Paraeggerthella hongkongensis]|uniref:hypothetical protein n=1 Tax=Paraeggerthella hongkongensis TaxID=230658 RepID=UPI001374C085|nr:hypothetical protein [Paraeggerthella hongkongensis]